MHAVPSPRIRRAFQEGSAHSPAGKSQLYAPDLLIWPSRTQTKQSTLVYVCLQLLLFHPIWLAYDSAQHGSTCPSDWSLSLAPALSVRHVASIEETRPVPEGEPYPPRGGRCNGTRVCVPLTRRNVATSNWGSDTYGSRSWCCSTHHGPSGTASDTYASVPWMFLRDGCQW